MKTKQANKPGTLTSYGLNWEHNETQSLSIFFRNFANTSNVGGIIRIPQGFFMARFCPIHLKKVSICPLLRCGLATARTDWNLVGPVIPIANASRSQIDAENKCLYIRIYCGI